MFGKRTRIMNARFNDERGVALVAVIGAAAILATLTTVIVARSIGNLGQVRRERIHIRTIHVAEAGIDHTLFKLSEDENYDTGDTPPPPFASPEEEKEWVLGIAEDKPVVQVPDGEWVAIKPPSSSNVIYSVGYSPSRAEPTKVRVIKAQYDFAGFLINAAVMTNGNLTVSGNMEVNGSMGSAHANGDVTVSGNPEFSGALSSTGSYTVTGSVEVGDPGNSGCCKPEFDVPPTIPTDFYDMSEYDLCPDGSVRTGPSYTGPGPEGPNASGVPCGGDLLADAAGSEYRGWKMTGTDPLLGSKWDYAADVAYDGVYYVYHGSAKVGGNPGTSATPWRATIIAEALAAGTEPHCPHIGGDIEISGSPDFLYHDKGQPMFIVAGRDALIAGDPKGSGVIMAHEQFGIPGNPELEGAVISDDSCNTLGSSVLQNFISGNPEFHNDGDYDVPGANIRTTHWLEL